MGLFSFTAEDLKRFSKAAKEVYAGKPFGLADIKKHMSAWEAEQKKAAQQGVGFANPPAPSQEVADEIVATVNRFLAVLARDHGQAYADEVVRKWRS